MSRAPSTEDTRDRGGLLETRGPEQSAGESFVRDASGDDEPRTIGRHRVLHRIGSGGMGVVYAAYDVELDRRIAIKVVKRRGSIRGNARLLREAQALARLSHPNVVQVFEVGTLPDALGAADGGVWVAMELVAGVSFGRWRTAARRRWREVLKVMREAGRGLVAAHDAGLIHRDFKPENVLVADDGRVLVIDFGLARAGFDEPSASGESSDRMLVTADVTQGGILGTPYYMAPEQHAGRELDGRTDQFAFCVTLWEAIYGERPFADDSPARAASAILRGELRAPPPSTVPEWLHDVIARGLSSDPADRWPSMSALLEELELLAIGERRRRRAWRLGGLGVGAAAVVFATTSWARPPCERDDDPLADAWDSAHAQAVRARLTAASASWGADTAQRTGEALDAWANTWREVEREACEATRVRGEASDTTMDLRMACLSERRRALRALVDVLAQADARAAERAIEAVRRLPRPEPCRDESYVGARVPPPADAEVAREVERIRERIAQASAHEEAGDPAAALPLAESALDDAIASGYAPVVAEALALRASAREKAGDYVRAALDAEDAYHAATAASHDTVALEAAQVRTFVALRQRETEQVRAWARVAQSTIDRSGSGELARAHVLLPLALTDADEGDTDRAITRLGEAVTIFEREEGLDSVNLASALNNLGVVYINAAQPAEGERVLARALAIRQGLLGADHPQVGSAMVNLATAISMQGRDEDAIEVFRQGADLLERAYGPDHLSVAQAQGNLAYMLLGRGETAEAIVLLERVATAMEHTLGRDHPDLANALGMLGAAYADAKQWPDAHDRLVRAMVILDARGGTDVQTIEATLQDLVDVLAALDRRAEARAAAERLIALLEQEPDAKAALASAKFSLARVLDPRERTRARALAKQARALLVAARGRHVEAVAEIDAWLARSPQVEN